ncbi:histidine kinase dimerization/phospho-acceptor domain-containing protein, partial [Salinispira pacifica]
MQGALQRKAVTAVSIAAALVASAALAAVLAAYAAGDVAAREALFLSAAIVAASAAAGIAIVRLVLRRYVEPLAAVIDSLRGTLAGDRPLLAEPSSTHLRALTREVGRATGHLFREIELLRKERDQMRSILESMVEGVVLLDADMRVRSANRAAEAIFDVSGRDLEGKTLLEAFRSAELADIAETVAKGAASDEADLTLYRESIRHLRVNAVSLPAERDSTGGVLLVLSDITRMKRLEQMRRDFVSNVSHELKTPVTSIKGFVETLLDGATDDPERSAHFLRIILKQTDRIHDIIEDLLHLARLEQNDAPIAYSRANAGE